jgi:hypothetical protein
MPPVRQREPRPGLLLVETRHAAALGYAALPHDAESNKAGRMMMVETSALAERLYEAWRAKQDFLDPLPDMETDEGWEQGRRARLGYFRIQRTRPRPRWALLTAAEQDVWKAVAEAAGRVMADAMGAL